MSIPIFYSYFFSINLSLLGFPSNANFILETHHILMCLFLSGRYVRLHVLFSWNRIHLMGDGAIPPFWVDAFTYSYATLINVWQHGGKQNYLEIHMIWRMSMFLSNWPSNMGHCSWVNCLLGIMIVQCKTLFHVQP